MDRYSGKVFLRHMNFAAAVLLAALTALASGVSAQTGSAAAPVVAETGVPEMDRKEALPSPGNVTVNFRDVDINTVLHYLSEVSGVDIVPAPGVTGKVTMRLRDKPWETAMDIVMRNYGYVYSKEDQIIRVMPRDQLAREETVTEVIALNHLSREIELTKGAERQRGEDVRVARTEISIQQLMEAINSLLDPARGEGATFIQSVNAIVITAIPTKMSEIKNIIASVDKRPAQIVLDAKVVEITLSKDERFGIDWNAVVTAAGARRPLTFPFTPEGVIGFLPGWQRGYYPDTGYPVLDAAGNPIDGLFSRRDDSVFPSIQAVSLAPSTDTSGDLFSFGTLDFSTFTATLQLLDRRGDTEVLSSPRITTLNNQKATIKVIDRIMLQRSVETTQTAALVTVEFESEEDAREVGVKLTVIPRVNDSGEISVHLLPEVSSDIQFREVDLTAVGSNTVALIYSSREANTTVRVNDGETIFLGGLIRKSVSMRENKFPILGDILGGVPVLGNAFKYEAETETRTEIVFFVTVNLVKDTLDSVRVTQSSGIYDRHILDKEEEVSADQKRSGPVIRKGRWKTSEKVDEIELPSTPRGEAVGKKPFLDFRKK